LKPNIRTKGITGNESIARLFFCEKKYFVEQHSLNGRNNSEINKMSNAIRFSV